MKITPDQVHLYLGLAMIGAGALVLLAVVTGTACGLFVLMFRVFSGRAQFARNKRRRSAHRRVVTANGEAVSAASYLSSPVLRDDTLPNLEAVKDDERP